MGLDVRFNARQLEASLQQVGDRALKHMADKMRQSAIRVRDLARDYAPNKTGLLEDSIDWHALPGAGMNRRTSYVVYIDVDALRTSGKPGVLADYAWLMEENLRPHGKGTGRTFRVDKRHKTGPKVGGGFLWRAVKAGIGDASRLEKEAGIEVRRMLNGASRIMPMNNGNSDYDMGE
jgi:hypothetical protein